MKSLRQVKDLINNLSKEKNINAQILLRNYMMERLLERISFSTFKDKFILKGGMLVASMVGVEMRSTVDMDAMVKSVPVTEEFLHNAFHSILAVKVDDGVEMTIRNMKEIRADANYKGYRISIEASLGKAIIPIKVDITTGDEITPKEIAYNYDLLLEDRSIEILAYNLETILAEKIETMISRGTANTRMRDYYDVFVLVRLYSSDIDQDLLSEAIVNTSINRGSHHLLADSGTILESILSSDILVEHWENYTRSYTYAENIAWLDVTQVIQSIWIYE